MSAQRKYRSTLTAEHSAAYTAPYTPTAELLLWSKDEIKRSLNLPKELDILLQKDSHKLRRQIRVRNVMTGCIMSGCLVLISLFMAWQSETDLSLLAACGAISGVAAFLLSNKYFAKS